ncbi:MAG: hypothetical protein KA116_10230 [Proteobacteria bacterium]|nr:hypothetical protein [Pseudomonadota bacterium]
MNDIENLVFQLERSGVSNSLLGIIEEGLPNSRDRMKLARLLEREFSEKTLSKSFGESLCILVDEGLSTLSECLKAIILLAEQEAFKEAPMAKLLGYISCCVEYQKTHPDSGDLSFLVLEFSKLN